MASIVKQKTENGVRYLVQLSPGEDISRPKIAFGICTRKDAETARGHIEKLATAKRTGGTLSPETQNWLVGIPGTLRVRLETLGLVEHLEKNRWTVDGWVEHYIKTRVSKPDTIRKLNNVRQRLNVFFKDDYIRNVSTFQAKNFRAYLKDTANLSENTIRRHIAMCRQLFNGAIDARIIEKNPFLGQAVTVKPNPARFFFVTKEIAEKVLAACPDAEWRLIFGLARWGGLRCPSEVTALKWTDIDFEKARFTVHSPKTEHHTGMDKRVVPMFPELKPLFQDAFDHAKEGAIYCVDRYKDGKEVNLRTQFERILKRAGVKKWTKLFQNCRSTRETELFKLTGGNVKAVCSWIGNSPEIALKHYAQISEADLAEAAKNTVLNRAEKTVHDPVQNTAKTDEIRENEEKTGAPLSTCDFRDLHRNSLSFNELQVGRGGFEPP